MMTKWSIESNIFFLYNIVIRRNNAEHSMHALLPPSLYMHLLIIIDTCDAAILKSAHAQIYFVQLCRNVQYLVSFPNATTLRLSGEVKLFQSEFY